MRRQGPTGKRPLSHPAMGGAPGHGSASHSLELLHGNLHRLGVHLGATQRFWTDERRCAVPFAILAAGCSTGNDRGILVQDEAGGASVLVGTAAGSE